MNCDRCQAKLPDDADFCPECGAEKPGLKNEAPPSDSSPQTGTSAAENLDDSHYKDEAQAGSNRPGPDSCHTAADTEKAKALAPALSEQSSPGIRMTANPHAIAPTPPVESGYPPRPFGPPGGARSDGYAEIKAPPGAKPRKSSHILAFLITLSCVMLMATLALCVFQAFRLRDLRRENIRLNTAVTEGEGKIQSLSDSNARQLERIAFLEGTVDALNSQNAAREQEIQALEDRIAFYEQEFEERYGDFEEMSEEYWFYHNESCCVEDDGTNLFHRYGCPDFAGESYWIFNTNRAIYEGYEPCPVCWDALY